LPFVTALRGAMLKHNLSASEVARRVWGTNKDARGYDVAKNRDRIGHYLAGVSYPEPENLQKLATAVDLPVEALAIANRPRPIPRDPRGVAMATPPKTVQLQFTPDLKTATLVIHRTVRAQLALKIIEMLQEDEDVAKTLEPHGYDEAQNSVSGASWQL
jgi:hypothetical protein